MCLETVASVFVYTCVFFHCRYFALSSQRLESLRTSLQGSSPTSPLSTASMTSSCSLSSRRALLENGEEKHTALPKAAVWHYSRDSLALWWSVRPLVLDVILKTAGQQQGELLSGFQWCLLAQLCVFVSELHNEGTTSSVCALFS